jgi:hypothetical protein
MEAKLESRPNSEMSRSEVIHAAMLEGARRAIEVHHKLGQDVVTWRDGKIAIVPAAELLAEFDKVERAEAGASKSK